MILTASNPPALPSFLASKYDLKPIINTPTDDDLKSIHAAIRDAKDASKLGELLPELNCSPSPVSDLEDYLFEAQMARYRSTHDFILSPKDLVYRPPTLPDHIANTVALQTITGPPSDAELKLVALANRTCEGFSNTSLFDADLEMNLSQHLFDLRLARYAQRATGIHYSSPSYDTNQHIDTDHKPVDQEINQQVQPFSLDSSGDSTEASSSTLLNPGTNNVKRTEGSFDGSSIGRATCCVDMTTSSINTHTCETNGMLGRIAEHLEMMNKVLINTQNSHAHVSVIRCGLTKNGYYQQYNSAHPDGSRLQEMINSRGELPSNIGLGPLYKKGYNRVWDPSDDALVRYLRFYGIGTHLFKTDTRNDIIVEEKKEDAIKTLSSWVS